MKTVLKIHNAVAADIADLTTYRALPTESIGMEKLNPFIFLNHHGPQYYPPENNGLPFGPHPHRGMETVTFILDGDIMHKDSEGHESVITAGGIQWMRAGKGLIHAEVSSPDFKKSGGQLEILQLWLNLPAGLKLSSPYYVGVNKENIPVINSDGIIIELISGIWNGVNAALDSVTGVNLSLINFTDAAEIKQSFNNDDVVFFYIVRGKCEVNGAAAHFRQLVEFDRNEGSIKIKGERDTIIILGSSRYLDEQIIANGPFVMNTRQEIMEAYTDYNNGRFGTWKD
jgi:quercetin 2,3-dioxygenase